MGDIIPISQCRHPALPTSVSASSVKSLTIELNDDLLDYFSRSEENYKVIQQSIPAILIKFNRQEKTLVVKVFFYHFLGSFKLIFKDILCCLNKEGRSVEGGFPLELSAENDDASTPRSKKKFEINMTNLTGTKEDALRS
jgi:hypothetical protein